MTDTPNLKLPYIAAAQAQKHVTHNEAIRALDAIVQLSVLDQDLATPPASPTDGDRYIVAASATGAWAGHETEIAAYQDGAWMFYAPKEGWLAWVADEDKLYGWDGTAWVIAGGNSLNPVTGGLVGINATADTTNRLAVSSPASLFNHAGAGHQLKVNKNAATDTASVLFQTGFSGRAEFGTTGDDDWHVKVSPDGSTWYEALIVDRNTGRVTFPSGGVRRQLTANTTWYVNAATGSDSNDGLTPGTAFATITKAVKTVIATDLNTFNATIQIAAGTYTESLYLEPLQGGKCTIIGDTTTPSNVTLVNVGSEDNITSYGLSEQWTVKGVKLTGNRVGFEVRGNLLFSDIDFATSFIHMRANYNGWIRADGNYTISASAQEHMRAANNAAIIMFNKTVTLVGTPNFSTAYARAQNRGFIRNDGMTFSGAATGKRYSAEEQAGINTGGGGASYFPGDVAGTTSLGGSYV